MQLNLMVFLLLLAACTTESTPPPERAAPPTAFAPDGAEVRGNNDHVFESQGALLTPQERGSFSSSGVASDGVHEGTAGAALDADCRMCVAPQNVELLAAAEIQDPGSVGHLGSAATIDNSKRWREKRISVAFLEGSPALRERVRSAAETWTQVTSITLDFVDSPQANIRIAFKPGPSESLIGTDALSEPSSKPTMNFGWLNDQSPDNEVRRVVLHEFGHALGFVHEHQNPSAGIPWDYAKVFAYFMNLPDPWTKKRIEDNILKPYSVSHSNYSAFDKYSIMAYPIPKGLTTNGFEIPMNWDLSETDRLYASVFYPRTAASASLYLPDRKKAYFFRGPFYYRYDFTLDLVDKVGRIGIDGWGGVWADGIDAAVYLASKNSVYFFKNDKYQRFPMDAKHVDKTGLIGKDGWSGVWSSGIDAAVVHPRTGNIYFFKDNAYQRFDVKKGAVDGTGITGQTGWRGVWGHGISTAVNHPNGKVYFFSGNQYQRFEFDRDQVDKTGTTGTDGWFGLQ